MKVVETKYIFKLFNNKGNKRNIVIKYGKYIIINKQNKPLINCSTIYCVFI